MKLLTQSIINQLAKNGEVAEQDPSFDPSPVVKLFTPDAGATWLLAWTDPQDPDIAFGLCDLGLGYAELGSVRLSEIASIRGRFGLPAERDQHWTPTGTLGAYAKASYPKGRIVEPD
ncbi:MAG: transposase [Phyllobacteriaceae bacterium]|nr:transposase [Phyllobacteriaceae bacterium]MBA89241.1 transposase [Phyllobacteriaceae bacterium]|tara:strand:- start:103 stop:453 length:351 start_codon:yes stop_codon:yes gene_type:complete